MSARKNQCSRLANISSAIAGAASLPRHQEQKPFAFRKKPVQSTDVPRKNALLDIQAWPALPESTKENSYPSIKQT